MATHIKNVDKGNRSSGLEWSIGDEDYAVRDKPAAAAPPPAETAAAPAAAPAAAVDSSKAAEVMAHYADGPAPSAHNGHTHGHGDHKKPAEHHGDGSSDAGHKGTKPGIRAAQQVLRDMGLYEKDGKHHNDVDGKIGPRTIAALNRADAVVRHELLQMLSPDELLAFHGGAHAGGHKDESAA